MRETITRRSFVAGAAAAAATSLAVPRHAAAADKPALLGGTPAHKGGWVAWPQWDASWEPGILDVFRSRHWCSAGASGKVGEFEKAYAQLHGAKGCVATASGTTALITSLYVAGVDAGDEVITSPYTFNATYNAVLMQKALPVFADTDPATLTMDPDSIESRITDRTRAILPVHIYGLPCDMDRINAIAKKHNLAVVEDACQAWLGEYKGRKCGTLGDLGCFSFQESKHIPAGEGGAITGMSIELLDRCRSFINCGRATGTFKGSGCFTRGSNFRMKTYQAALLFAQVEKLVRETEVRRANADYLIAGLKQIPGIHPVRWPENSRPVWHLFPFRYDAAEFHGLPHGKFIRALQAEGIPCGGGYSEQYFDGMFDEAIASRGFQRLFSPERLKAYRQSFQDLKGNRQVCQTTVTMYQSMLLAERSAMDDIITAVQKIHAHSAELAKA